MNHPAKPQRITKENGYYKRIQNSHYYGPQGIHLKTHKQEAWNRLTFWLCGKKGNTSNNCPHGEESKLQRGKMSQENVRKYQ